MKRRYHVIKFNDDDDDNGEHWIGKYVKVVAGLEYYIYLFTMI
jgi:hypothetical protein